MKISVRSNGKAVATDMFAPSHRVRETVGGTTCSVPGCYNNTREDGGVIHFYRFPTDTFIRRLWVAKLARGPAWKPSAFSRICGNHFIGGQKTDRHPHPTIFPSVKSEKRRRQDSRRAFERGDRQGVAAGEELPPQAGDLFRVADDQGACALSSEKNGQPMLYESTEETAALIGEINRLKSENSVLLRLRFSLNRYKSDQKGFHFYTGLRDYRTFSAIFNRLLAPQLAKLKFHGHVCEEGSRESFDRRNLSPEEEFFCFLCILRRSLDQEDLANRLGVSQATISRVWTTWLRFVHDRLCQVPMWLPRSVIDAKMPKTFKRLFPETRVVLDCTDILIEMPSAFRAQSETYSSYKHHNSAKGLVAIAPHGAIVFASGLYGGRTSDKAILKDCGLLPKLEEGDALMADRGFDVADILPRGTHLFMPSFMDQRPQLPKHEETQSRGIASARVHVERIIRRVKCFRILSEVFPLKMKSSLDMIWQVCVRLANFGPPPIAVEVPDRTDSSVVKDIEDLDDWVVSDEQSQRSALEEVCSTVLA